MKICRFPIIAFLLLGFGATFGCLKLLHAASPEMSGSIKEVMSPAEFKAAGLNKLTPDELQKLDAWIQGYRQVAEQKAEKIATARAAKVERTKMDLLVSRVDGTFNGLTGRTII